MVTSIGVLVESPLGLSVWVHQVDGKSLDKAIATGLKSPPEALSLAGLQTGVTQWDSVFREANGPLCRTFFPKGKAAVSCQLLSSDKTLVSKVMLIPQ